MQAVSESLPLKLQIFKSLAASVQPKAILASNTSSISITKVAAGVVPEGVSAASEEGKEAAGRVVGLFRHCQVHLREINIFSFPIIGLHFFNPVPVMVGSIHLKFFQTVPETYLTPECNRNW
jgi:3-hydroxybutyryl-CoA dehydrogenase